MRCEITTPSSDDWYETTWGELVELKYGKGLREYKDAIGKFPVYGTNGAIGWCDKPLCEFPSIIIGRKGAYRGVHYSDFPFYVIDTAYFIVPKKDINLKWAYYHLLTQDINGLDSGSAIPSTRREDFYHLPVRVPPLKVQDEIVSNLDSFNDKIALNRQINQTLEAMAQDIFKSWFVNFEPVKAKIAAIETGENAEGVTRTAMRTISGKTDDELDQMQAEQPENYAQLKTTAELFPSAMQDSELGDIPEGWKVKKIIDFGTVVCGKTPPKKDSENYGGDIPFVKIPDMHGNVFATNTTEYLSVIGQNTQIKKQIPKGSVCVSCIATVGLVSIAAKACHTNQQINSIVPIDIMLTPYLYLSMLERNKLLHDLASGGSTTLNLNTGNFAKIELFNPSSELLKEFYKKVNPIFEMLLSNDYQVQQLTQLRDTLLPKLLSGELSVDATELAEAEA